MGKFPQIVEWVLRKNKQVVKNGIKHKLSVMIMISFVVAISGLVYSKPFFYKQAFNMYDLDGRTRGVVIAKVETAPDFFPAEESEMEKELYAIVGDYPIKEMIPYIAKKDKTVAAFIVGIAKKESNWGKRVPTKNGQDCFNYWGYKGAGKGGIAMGHGCFSSPEEAVDVIGRRLEQLVGKNLTTPSKMVVWKCGSNCAVTGGQAAANKWISDVSIYFDRIIKIKA